MQRAGALAEQNGLKAVDGVHLGAVNQFSGTNVMLDLVAGRSYSIVGVCDNDCSNLDLWLYDPAGAEIAGDGLPDDTPVINVTPGSSGTYRLRVGMVKCTSSPCQYGVRTFVK